MPKEITKHTDILSAIEKVDIISELLNKHNGHYEYELDLEVIAYGRNYQGKKVGPYMRLYVYDPGEVVIKQGDWGGNTFYVNVDGSLDVLVEDKTGAQTKVGALQPGASFGEMSILAGVPRNATVKAPPDGKATVLEVTRPALRLLRKLPKFGHALDVTYRKHGLGRTLEDLRQATGNAFSPELLKKLGNAARFMVYGKQHILFREGGPIDRITFVKNGWVRRVRGIAFNPAVGDLAMLLDENIGVDFLGAGNCLGLEGLVNDARWKYTATVLQRTEVLEISISHLRADTTLRDLVLKEFSEFSIADDDVNLQGKPDRRIVTSTEREITTGVVDGTNLLVMDMDLCVRCGNCSMACHQVHGRSRLLRRGIHIERPKHQNSAVIQHVLSPSVCMHCQDPECLTGCPTGAIGRFSGGQVDIDPKTCIGCGDCATQCPYNAISMIPRKPSAPLPATFFTRTREWLNLASPTPPQPVTETENLVAVKCNLCNNTPLNPIGAKQQAYSCQENCPTGALVRVNPREYFAEVSNKVGLIFRDQTHAIGRDIHKSDPLARLWNIGGVLGTVILTLLTLWGIRRYGLDGVIRGTWVTVRWLTGIVGLLGIAVVMSYPARKQVYRRRAGALRYWMLCHVYFGVVAGVLLLLHGGTNSGGVLTSFLMVSFDLVILSGLFGIACYLIVPRIMTSIEGEPLLIEDLRARRDELRNSLAEMGERSTAEFRSFVKKKVSGRFLSLGFLLRQYIRREELSAQVAGARETFEAELKSITDPETRRLLLDAIAATVTLRRVDSLIYLHQLLKLWLAPHVVASSLMLMLMFVHIVQVIFFNVHR